MLDNLNEREKAVLARICMRKIVAMLDERDFGRYQIPGIAYARPHLGSSSTFLFQKYYAKLSPQGQKWYNDNAEAVLVAGSADIKDTELPYYKAQAEAIKKNNGGHIINAKSTPRQGKQDTTNTAGQSSSPKQKNAVNR
ncbi:MAG: hypothetical protein J6S85_26405 [Methanobrevibacter sp.]|nr:hypothetical protein [Methanobrevibacter sp.]MBO7717126.1 hypothetical protein [Methanobrevibacter sp.]